MIVRRSSMFVDEVLKMTANISLKDGKYNAPKSVNASSAERDWR